MTEQMKRDDEARRKVIEVIGDRLGWELIGELVSAMRSDRRWRTLRRAMFAGLILLGGLIYFAFYASMLGYKTGLVGEQVAVVPIEGVIAKGAQASAEKLIPLLETAFENSSVKAVVLEISSGGGSPSESERINTRLAQLKKEFPKPVYAVCDGLCGSAAYMIAIHTDAIYAGKYSIAGSIGAIMKSWDYHAVLQKIEVSQRVFASGDLKDLNNPYKELTARSEAKLNEIVRRMADQFIAEVKAARGDKLPADKDLFTGEIWDGQQALELGLIDKIGTFEDLQKEKYPTLVVNRLEPKRGGGISFLDSLVDYTDSVISRLQSKYNHPVDMSYGAE